MLEDILKDFKEEIVTEFKEKKYGGFLDCVSRFYNYSPRNIFLIYSQMKTATSVASYSDWKKHGYQVKQGEKGLKIICPIISEDEDEVKFRVGHVFDISQVINIKAVPTPKPDFDIEMALESLLLDLNTKVEIVNEIPDVARRGYYKRSTGQIVILKDTPKRMFDTLLHEKRHSLRGKKFTIDEEEIIVESAAYVASKHFGIEREDAPQYVAFYCENNTFSEVDVFLTEIIKTSKELIQWVKDCTHLQEKTSVA